MRAAFCLTCCAGLLFAGARRTVQSGRDRLLGSLIRRCSARRDLWNKVPPPACTRPASVRARVLTARVSCSHRHSVATRGRERGDTAGRCAAARDGSLPQVGPADDGRGKRRGGVPKDRAGGRRAVSTRKVGMEAQHGAVVALSQYLILQCVRVCLQGLPCCDLAVCATRRVRPVCARATRAISNFRSRHPLGSRALRMHVLKGSMSCE